ncbi:PLP-dependent aminotransferase family protein [Clostridium sp. MB40-C1]|uniref:MocR-like pyridoxine biosynthesis transcription factor PdxR n=1 Tax=Clostridium sp. MB40-C1 TaxID=3070996 RepID=UPI0027DF8B3C|nr:PLP-dependent aminotransferase family protein [Clostridium sp. MB40-C1]WMJ79919.1 PLP-dependent aminotransferase family protein [Clostridium sp. MB40-C1]
MFADINLTEAKPIYTQIHDYIKEMIKTGMLPHGSKLPSTRELGKIINVSRNSIIKAYESLEDDELVYTIKGKGTFVSHVKVILEDKWTIDWTDKINNYANNADKLDIIKTEKKYKKGMISFKSIAPDGSLFDMEEFKRAFSSRISIEREKILNYGYAQGYKPLIDYLMEYMQSKGVNTTNKDILVTNGFTEGFDIVLSSLTKKGDKLLCENPTHNTALKIMKLQGLDVIGIDMKEDGLNISKLKSSLKENDIKIAYLVPSYHNPTGIVTSSEKRQEIYNILKEHNIPIIEDGFNEELLYLGSHIAPMAAFCGEGNGVIYIGSFSKILFPGMRIGWVLGDKKLIDILESVKRSKNIHTSFLDQALLYEYLKNGGFDKYLKKARKFYKDKYTLAVKLATKYIPCESIIGDGGLHIFIKLKNIDARELLNECYKKGVLFLPGDIFSTNNQGENTFRLGFSRVSDEDMKKGFKIIGECIKHLSVTNPHSNK